MPFDLQWLKDLAAIIQSILVGVAAIATLLGVNAWRRQTVGKRKMELAEQVLASFYEAADMLNWARSPFSSSSEGVTRQADEPEGEDLKRIRDSYYVPIERLRSKSELLSKLHAQRYSFRALFGRDANLPFDAFWKLQNDIAFSARTLIEFAGEDRDVRMENKDLIKQCKLDIYGRAGDPISLRIDETVALMEKLCKPILLQEAHLSTTELSL